MSILDSLITDRTQTDVDAMNAKGSYNAADLNRVQEAMHYLADRFSIYGYVVTLHDIREWTKVDIPTQSDLDAYLEDLAALRSVLEMAETTPDAPESMDFLTYVEANNIEQILVDIDALLDRVAASWFYSGEIYCGEV